MDRLQIRAHVLWRSTFSTVQRKVVLLGRFIKDGLGVGCGQTFEEPLVRGRNAVVDLVSARPQCVSSGLGQLGQTQDGIVAWHGLEGDVAVPSFLAALLLDEAVRVDLLRLLAGDNGDLVVVAA